MPKKFVSCVKKLMEKGASSDMAYGVCTNMWKKSHGGKPPKLHRGGKKDEKVFRRNVS